jgi:hypothetical protein
MGHFPPCKSGPPIAKDFAARLFGGLLTGGFLVPPSVCPFVGRDLKTAPLNAIPAPSFENRHKFIFEKQLEKINDFIRTAKFAAFELVGFLGRLKLPF